MPGIELHSERELLERISEGDERAFEMFFRKWATPLATIAGRIVQSDYARQEVVQEVFIKIWLYRDRLPEVNNIGGWLRKVTVNRSLLVLQRQASEEKHLSGIAIATTISKEEDRLEDKETRRLINKAIDALPPQRRTIYQMNRIEGKTTREIAEQLNLSHGYVRNALSAALTDIRERLKTDLGLPLFLVLLLF